MLTRRSTGRWLLLLATAAGLLFMHTLGHLRHSDTHHASAGFVTATMVAMDTDGSIAGHETGTSADPAQAPGMPMDPTSICLAVLSVAALVALMFLLDRRSPYGHPSAPTGTGGRWLSGRGPPGQALGLRISDLSVMRN